MMKRIKPYVFAVLVIMTVMCLSACGSNKNATNETTGGSSAAATQTSAMESSSAAESSSTDMGNTRNADEDAEESTGVIDGMINDVEKGVDDITGESNGHPTNSADMSSAAE